MAEDRQRKFTKLVQERYLGALAASGLLVHSADVAGVNFDTVDIYRRKNPEFNKEVELAQKRYNELVEAEIHRRGMKGYKKAVFYKGERVDGGEVVEYSDRLLELLAKKRMPEYRERIIDAQVASGGVLVVNAPAANVKEWKEKSSGQNEK